MEAAALAAEASEAKRDFARRAAGPLGQARCQPAAGEKLTSQPQPRQPDPVQMSHACHTPVTRLSPGNQQQARQKHFGALVR